MASWRRINQSKLRLISQQFRRCYSPVPNPYYLEERGVSLLQKPHWCIHQKPTDFFSNVRFFAAPAQYLQVKPKKEEPGKHRLNGEITARFVRLVTEDGHCVISREEALQRARQLKEDLVEVQSDADPPVCKIMNFKRELYKKQQILKSRAKEKAGLSVRNVPPKEVRVTPKIEKKDLEMKARTVRRLMDDGYRVKCTAHIQGKELEGEQEKLRDLLTRFTALIADVAVLESEPRVEKRSAYAIVKHEKFGLGKKGNAKKLSAVVGSGKLAPAKHQSDAQPEDDSKNSASPVEDDSKSSVSSVEDETEYDPFAVPSHLWDGDTAPPSPQMTSTETESRHQKSGQKNQFSPQRANTFHPSDADSPPEIQNRHRRNEPRNQSPPPRANTAQPSYPPEADNRYRRNEPRNQFPPPGANTAQPSYPPEAENRYRINEPRNQFQPPRPMDHKGQVREPFRPESELPYQRRQPPVNSINGSATAGGQTKQGVEKPPQRPLGPSQRDTPEPSYGIFSNPKLNSHPKR